MRHEGVGAGVKGVKGVEATGGSNRVDAGESRDIGVVCVFASRCKGRPVLWILSC